MPGLNVFQQIKRLILFQQEAFPTHDSNRLYSTSDFGSQTDGPEEQGDRMATKHDMTTLNLFL